MWVWGGVSGVCVGVYDCVWVSLCVPGVGVRECVCVFLCVHVCSCVRVRVCVLKRRSEPVRRFSVDRSPLPRPDCRRHGVGSPVPDVDNLLLRRHRLRTTIS